MNAAPGMASTPSAADPKSRVDAAMAAWLQELAPYGILTTDHELRVVSWNEWLAHHSGMTAADVLGRPLPDIFPELQERRLAERYARALAGEVSVLSTALHKYLLPFPVTVDDSGLPHMLQTARVAPLREAGTVVGTITFIEDVTQREVQASILNRQQELDRLLSSSLARLLQSNDPAAEMGAIFSTIGPALNLDAYLSYLLAEDGQSLRLNASGGISPKQRDTMANLPLSEAVRERLRSESRPDKLEFPALDTALQRLGLRGHASFPLAVGQRVVGLVTFASYERETIAAADLGVLTRISRYVAIALDRALRERETVAASSAKDDFLAALSHELRTPLNPVLLVASDGAQNPSFSAEARQAFQVVEKNALLEARLIDDLLDMTRIEHGKISLEMQTLDAHAVLRDALETVRVEAEQHGLALHVELATARPMIVGDSGRLQQVFWNVIKNSVKFTSAGGEVRVTSTVDRAAGEIAVKVRDTGIGMDQHELTRVFDAFSQGDHAASGRSHRFGGLGLGLAISRKLVDLHGGRIEASSEGKGKGALFVIYLPLTSAPKPVGPSSADLLPASEPPAPAKKPGSKVGARILLIEDHEPTRSTLGNLLKRRGYQIVAVDSSSAALKAAEDQPFDLVLSDIGLPDGDGFQLMRTLRDRHGLKGIALTGYGMEEDLLRSTNAGFFAHLTKPINVKVLDRALEEAFSRSDS